MHTLLYRAFPWIASVASVSIVVTMILNGGF